MKRHRGLLALLAVVFSLLAGCERADITRAEEAMQAGNYAEAYYVWRQLAERGHPVAMYNIGWMYHNGYGLVIDDQAAAKWWRNAAESGLEEAEQALGMLYYYGGKGVARDLETSAKYLMPGAARGDEEAALLLETFIGELDPAMRKRFEHLRDEQLEEEAEALDGKPLRISVSRANLRAEPSTAGSLVTTLNQGALVGELERRTDWVKIQYTPSAAPAWVHASLVESLD